MEWEAEYNSPSEVEIEYETSSLLEAETDYPVIVIDTYKIAVREGFQGTVDEWLESLQGKDGKDGKDGRDGADGPQGEKGKDGYTPIKGVDYFDGIDGKDGVKGDPFRFEDFTPEQLASLKGDKGDKGDGADVDLTPYAKKTELPTKYSDLINDKGYVALKDATKVVHVTDINNMSGTSDVTSGQIIEWMNEGYKVVAQVVLSESLSFIVPLGTTLKMGETDFPLFYVKNVYDDELVEFLGTVVENSFDFTVNQEKKYRILKAEYVNYDTYVLDDYNDNLGNTIIVPTKTSYLENDSGYATNEYVDDSVYNITHTERSVRKLNTYQRNFTDANWSNYGAIGHIDNWSSTANYNDFKVGDLGVLYGKNTTTGKYVALVGEVTQVTSSLQMRTIACYQTDAYKEVTEYNVNLTEDLESLKGAVNSIESVLSTKADKSQIPTVPKNVSAFTNDAGYLTEHQDISGKLDVTTFETAWNQAQTIINGQDETLNSKADKSEIPTRVSELENDENYLAEVKATDIVPLAKKTYQNVIATANTQDDATFYMFKVTPKSYYEPCMVKWHVRAYINETMTGSTKANFFEETFSEMVMAGASMSRYLNSNAIYSTSYRPYYYLSAYRTTKAGFDKGLPHYVGVSLLYSTSPTSLTLKRDIEVEILEAHNCTVELLDTPVVQGAFYNSTDYSGVSNTDGHNQGTKQTGDSNSIDRLCYGSFAPKAGASMYGTQLVLSADGETFYSICQSRTTALTKKCTDKGFRPEHIMYYSSATTVSTGNRVATSTMYEMLPFDFRYSHNIKALTIHKPVYLRCTYSEGLYYLEPSGWMTQDVPIEDDGYYYILVGYSYTANSIYIKNVHPIFAYRNGRVRGVNPDLDEPFMVTITPTSQDFSSAEADKTFSEIYEAHNAGRQIKGHVNVIDADLMATAIVPPNTQLDMPGSATFVLWCGKTYTIAVTERAVFVNTMSTQ